MGQMAAMGKAHAHNGIPGIQHGEIYRRIGLGAGMRLHIGMLRAKQLFRTLTRQLLNFIHDKAAAIIPF